MGATFVSARLKSDDRKDAEKEFRALQEDCRYESGNGGYTGTFAEARSISFSSQSFVDVHNAVTWLEDNTEKWEAAIAVKIEGRPGWFVGATVSC